MKNLIIFIFLIFLIATTFLSDNTTGWYQQALPVNDVVMDISFIDSLRGWVITQGSFNNHDTGYIMKTDNGGINWTVQYDSTETFNVIQFVNDNVGYAGGGFGRASFYRTTNGGLNWQHSIPFGAYNILDLKFINEDTGWACSDDDFDGGVFRTINGGDSWIRQTTPSQLRPLKLFFINKDTGWALSEGSISKTINGGNNWSFLHGVAGIEKDLFFLNNDTGWVISVDGNPNGIIKTTNGGINWIVQRDPNPFGSVPNSIYLHNNFKGWIATGRSTILSLANDSTWGKQSVPSGFPLFNAIQMIDTNLGYSGGTMSIKTNEGGGTITDIKNTAVIVPQDFILYQNYPNPFNGNTKIKFTLVKRENIILTVYDLQGKEIRGIANGYFPKGDYEFNFDASLLPSGIYFYSLKTRNGNQTRKMILSK